MSPFLQVLLLWHWFRCINSSGKGHCRGRQGHCRVCHQRRAHAAKGIAKIMGVLWWHRSHWSNCIYCCSNGHLNCSTLLCYYIQLKMNAKQKEFFVLRFIMCSCTSEIETSPVCKEYHWYYYLCVYKRSHDLHCG